MFSRRSSPYQEFQADEPSPMLVKQPSNRLTWFGGFFAVLGWVLLIAAMTLSDVFFNSGNLVAAMSLRSDAVTIGQTLVMTGLGMAAVGALRQGFGALTRFFDAVLQRSTLPREEVELPEPVAPIPMTAKPSDRMPSSAKTKGSNYVILADGSVEVETLLGTRVFATLEEARDFIR